ncbi:hypothetical protein D9758_008115 [Tetrapyrgos nigripes]|uniref:F-box domain-containing protein n=1 Tax=Tetrapyrgos nigripes TaxID=182062 RepID=A0A8H5GH79_9AGAR|nr:hypothetical protein D9758_008115 [Tetrapyrgos nigripes]
MGDRHSTGRTPQELLLLETFPSFQPRVQDIDLQSPRDRIRSPGSPTSSESSQLSELISNTEQDLSDYEKDIRSLENVLLDLSKKKQALERYVDHCKAYLSPIRRLPTEIMGEIFLIYQDLHRSNRKDRQFREPLNDSLYSSEDMTALVLSSVCKLWHSICLSTPSLWSRFSLNISEECGSLFHLLEIYLSRSKQHPLTFDIFVEERVTSNNTIIPLLLTQSHRWFCTSCCCGPDFDAGLDMQMDLPLLQNLEVTYGMLAEDPLGIFASARTPRTVSLLGISEFLHSSLRWDQIHFLRAHELCTGDVGLPRYVWELAQKCCALRSLELDFDEYALHEPAGLTSSIHLSKLESLCLHCVTWYDVFELFSVSAFPNLRKLSLCAFLDEFDDEDPSPNTAAFPAFISRSQCSISILRLESLQKSTVQLVCGLLHHIPTLTELIVEEEILLHTKSHDPYTMATLMETLHVPKNPAEAERRSGEHEPVLPLLHRLVMEVNADRFEASRFVDMLESRGLAGGSLGALKSVRLFLQWSCGADDCTLLGLQSLRGPGIEIITSTALVDVNAGGTKVPAAVPSSGRQEDATIGNIIGFGYPPFLILLYNNLAGTVQIIGPVPNLLLPLTHQNYRLRKWATRTGRTPLELLLLQTFPSFQPRVQDIDLQSPRDRIRSPGSPTSSESTQLSELISNAEQDLFDYEKDIHILENVLLDLSKKKEELERYVDHCKAYLSPIRRLPTEIMGEIFLYYQDLHRSNREDGQYREPLTGTPYRNQAMTALVLSSVCKLWHTITLATPRLWSRFSLQISEKCAPLSHLLEIYLSRSKQHPLTFDIAVYGEGPTSKNIIRLLSAHSHRWSFVSCYGRCTGLNMQTDLALLQSLEMKYGGANSLDAFAGARTLRTVTLFYISRLHSNLPWDQVHFLRAHRLEIDTGLPKYVWELAQKCRALRSLELNFDHFPPHEQAGFTSSLHLSKLESLSLQHVMSYNVCELFSVSTLPSLRKLSLGLYHEGPTPNTAAFSDFISRSQCSLSVLRFTKLRKSMVQLVCGMLHHIPTLTELIVGEGITHLDKRYHDPITMTTLMETLHVPPNSVEAERRPGENEPVLPLLHRLVMEVNADVFEASRFVDMLESRGMLAGGSLGALKSVQLFLQWNDGAKDSHLQSLETWPGMEIIASTSASRQYLHNEDSQRWV